MKTFSYFVEGAGRVLVLDTGTSYRKPDRHELSRDRRALRGDVVHVSKDMHKSVERYEHKTNSRALKT
ncbi:hypothetical protein [Acidithiobacillus thiooxidans]|uniref:Uncharacterized protein n=1 Tax=Acidithiobacillus thiooxidans ATCC 19377 TaxID=637390 RepID=A0A543Q1W6_ACITH|nr:hypothetical protein [Acidithiobacillus thiooxidans]MDX5935520.1 hypothetical protein [Acidithiobacillus thiooxidans]TQN50339.1 hypothetical protein DLNHIDIE_00192 [Acidithiobacillus thiooxidans ATCC 19377]